jgi:glycosyltransferase involved in cell wall biosynthesis
VSRIALVVPMQDEADSIADLLGSIARQSLQPDEIVLVDAGSRDGTVQRAYEARAGLPVRIVREERVNPGTARNRGVAETDAEWIAFTDAGITVDPEWLRELVSAAGSCDAVLGRVDPVCNSWYRQCLAVACVPALDGEGTRGPFIASSLIRRSAFDRVGGFPPFRAAEDLVFLHRLRRTGATISRTPRALVHWQIAGSAAATFRRFALYSKHNLMARWERHWHWGIARLYCGLAVVSAIAAAGLGVRVALGFPLVFFLARSTKAAWQKRKSFGFSALHPLRVVGAAGVLMVIDAATLAGFLSWLREGRPRSLSD